MHQNNSEILGLRLLEWLFADDALSEVFLGATGVSRTRVAQAAADPDLLAAVLDFVLMDDQWVLSAAAFAGVSPDQMLQARAALPGGDVPNWT